MGKQVVIFYTQLEMIDDDTTHVLSALRSDGYDVRRASTISDAISKYNPQFIIANPTFYTEQRGFWTDFSAICMLRLEAQKKEIGLLFCMANPPETLENMVTIFGTRNHKGIVSAVERYCGTGMLKDAAA